MGFRQAQNVCRIEGLLAETDLKYGSFVKNGETVETVGGTIKVLVEQEINGKKNISIQRKAHRILLMSQSKR